MPTKHTALLAVRIELAKTRPPLLSKNIVEVVG